MGDPRKTRKKYSTPSHPWEKIRIDEEKVLKKDYGLKNKKEIWKFTSKIRKINTQVKKIISQRTSQSALEEKQLLDKLYRMGVIEKETKLEDVLGLDVKRLLDRRLQSLVYKQKLANSIGQARQFIVHGHVSVGDRKVTIPSYIVLRDEEDKIKYVEDSSLINPEHPERKVIEKEKKKEKIKKESVVKKEELKPSEKAKVEKKDSSKEKVELPKAEPEVEPFKKTFTKKKEEKEKIIPKAAPVNYEEFKEKEAEAQKIIKDIQDKAIENEK